MHQYRIERITRIPSGDHLEMIIDLGFFTTTKISVVLENIECPDIGEFVEGKDIGLAARDFVVQWFREKHQPWTVITRRKVRGTENTWIATVLDAQGGALNDALLGAGHATNTED